jgi:hypothetical protein
MICINRVDNILIIKHHLVKLINILLDRSAFLNAHHKVVE